MMPANPLPLSLNPLSLKPLPLTSPLPLPLALTLGNPSGIGPELVLKAWLRRRELARPFFVLGDLALLGGLARMLSLDVPLVVTIPAKAADLFAGALPVVPLAHAANGLPGRPMGSDAPATLESIRRAVELVHRGEAAAIVTNPISKAALQQTGFAHPGHTEFLGELASEHYGVSTRPVMMIWSPELAVVPVTIHVALHQVPQLLTRELIVATGLTTAHDLRTKFGIAHPRLAFTGLNPHAGEDGRMGLEDRDIIAPAIAELIAHGIHASGPHPADTLFHAAARQKYDVVLGMYHDQVLIPVKTLAFDHGVNVTLGLPFIRTSPDHGTAFDIAGHGIAEVSSLMAALNLAARLA